MPKWGEDFDTWEPTQDYPSAPPARSAQLGQVPSLRPRQTGLPPSSTDSRAASFFQEFSAATEAAGNAAAARSPELPYGDNPGIAALIANAQNMLNSDGPDAPSSFGDGFAPGADSRQTSASRGASGNASTAQAGGSSARGTAGLPSARGLEDIPEALRESLEQARGTGNRRDSHAGGERGRDSGSRSGGLEPEVGAGFDSGNGLAYGAILDEGIRPTRGANRGSATSPSEPVRSEGWKKLVNGWNGSSPNTEPENAEFSGSTSQFLGQATNGYPGMFNSDVSVDFPGMAPHETTPKRPTPPGHRPADSTFSDALRAAPAGSLGAKPAVTSPRDYFSAEVPRPSGERPDSAAPLEPPVWKSISAATPEGPTKLRFRRVDGTGTAPIPAEPRESGEGLSPVAMVASAVLLSLICVGIGVGVGMSMNPPAAPNVSASPHAAEPNISPREPSSDSVSNKDQHREENDTASGGLQGLKVVIDPGHNGGNAAAWQQIGQNVDDGRGGQHACNTTGTATDDGFTEHEFNWKIANLLKTKLESAGAIVLMTRDSDVGVGPCVNDRGAFPQKVGADVMVSIHANGTTDTKVHGFFAMLSDPPLHEAQKEPAAKLATALVESLKNSGLSPQNGGTIQNGIWKRSDLATLNFAEVPAVMLELGEMRNPADASLMKTDNGREKFATGIFNGLKAWVDQLRPLPGASPSTTPASPDAPASPSTPASPGASPTSTTAPATPNPGVPGTPPVPATPAPATPAAPNAADQATATPAAPSTPAA